jgi:hypothetical protein
LGNRHSGVNQEDANRAGRVAPAHSFDGSLLEVTSQRSRRLEAIALV